MGGLEYGGPLTPMDQACSALRIVQTLYFPSPAVDVDLLRTGLERLVAEYPSLGAFIVDSATPYHPVIGGPFTQAKELLNVLDMHDQDYAEWRATNFVRTAAPIPVNVTTLPTPVFRATLVRAQGGAVLVATMSHAFSDGTGSSKVLSAWAAACRGEPFELFFDRSRMLHGSSSFTDVPETRHPLSSSTAPTRTTFWWVSGKSLRELQERASDGSTPDKWISRLDALSALIRVCVADSRAATGMDMSSAKESFLATAVDVRRRMDPPLPPTYVGNGLNVTLTHDPDTFDFRLSFDDRLRAAARMVRESITSVCEASVMDVLGLLEAHGCPALASASILSSCSTYSLCITSWVGQETYQLDWGRVFDGQPCERLRASWFPQMPGGYGVYMPRGCRAPDDTVDEDGLEIGLNLVDTQMAQLLQHKTFAAYATHAYDMPNMAST